MGSTPQSRARREDRRGHRSLGERRDLGAAPARVGEWTDRLDDLVERVGAWAPEQLRDLSELAADTGAGESLRRFLREVGAPEVAATRALVISVEDWRLHTLGGTVDGLPWLVRLLRTPWWKRPAVLWHAVWPTDDELRAKLRAPLQDRRALRQARWQRLRRGARGLPTAARRLGGAPCRALGHAGITENVHG